MHIGNGVWLSNTLFEEKIVKSKVSPSIALRDATANVYSTKQLAQRSLDGGTPIKGNGDKKKLKKKRMTPAKKESLLGNLFIYFCIIILKVAHSERIKL